MERYKGNQNHYTQSLIVIYEIPNGRKVIASISEKYAHNQCILHERKYPDAMPHSDDRLRFVG